MLFPHDSTIPKIMNARSLSILGIVCLLILSSVAAGPKEGPTAGTGSDVANAASAPTTQPRPRRAGNRSQKNSQQSSNGHKRLNPHRPVSRQSGRPATESDAPPHRMPTTNPVVRRPNSRPTRTPTPRRTPPKSVAPKRPAEFDSPVDYGMQDIVESPGGEASFRIRYKFPKDAPRYLIVENEFKDRGGIPGLLTYTAESASRVTIVQRVNEAGVRVRRPSDLPTPNVRDDEHTTHIEWTVDRFEAREKALGEEHKFDSLRDSYPIASLRRLGSAAGAKITFSVDGWTGTTQRVRIQPGRSIGPATRRKLSKTTQKCLLDNSNVERLMDDIGPLVLPRTPVRIGESWTRIRDKEIRNFGKSTTTYTMTLQRVNRTPESPVIAEVLVSGTVELIPDPMPAKQDADSSTATTQPGKSRRGRRNKRPQKRHDFKLDSATIAGSFRFDITNGMLLDYTLRRDSSLSAEMKSEEMGDMSLVNAEAHTLRIKTLTSEPAKPMIVGGPKPPKDDPADLIKPKRNPRPPNRPIANRNTAERRSRAQELVEQRRKSREQIEKRRQAALHRRGLTTQPATSQPMWPIPREITSRPTPVVRKRPSTQPTNATTRPASRDGTTPPGRVPAVGE